MIEFERVLRQIEGGRVFVDQMREFDMQETLTGWKLGLLRLESVWNIARSINDVEKNDLVARIVSLFKKKDQIFSKFAEMSQDEGVSFEEALIQICESVSGLKRLATGLIEIELGETTACLIPSEKEGFVELSLRMKGLSPSKFLVELATDLEMLRRGQDPELRQKNIIAYSWLLDMKKKKTIKILNSLGIGPANGARVFTIDPNDFEAETDSRVIIAAATAVPLANVNVDRFLRTGRLPRVGVLTMNASDFWR